MTAERRPPHDLRRKRQGVWECSRCGCTAVLNRDCDGPSFLTYAPVGGAYSVEIPPCVQPVEKVR